MDKVCVVLTALFGGATVQSVQEFEVDRWRAEASVLVAMASFDTAPAPQPGPNPTPYKCSQCKDTGFITHGDGHKTPCPSCRPGEPVPAVEPVDVDPFQPVEPVKIGCGCGNPECECSPDVPCDGQCACCGPAAEPGLVVLEACAAQMGPAPIVPAVYKTGGDLTLAKMSNTGHRITTVAAPCRDGNCPARPRPVVECPDGVCPLTEDRPAHTFRGACGDCAGAAGCGACHRGPLRAVAGFVFKNRHGQVRIPGRRVVRFFQNHRPVRRALGGTARFLWRMRPGIIFRRCR